MSTPTTKSLPDPADRPPARQHQTNGLSRHDTFRQMHPFTPMDPLAPASPTSWLVPGLLMEHKINFMFGAEKSGKSRLLRQLMAHMAYEQPLFGTAPTYQPGRTLYLAGEEMPADVTNRLMHTVRALGLDPDDHPWDRNYTLVQAAGMRLDDHRQRRWIRDELEGGGYRCLMVDPLRRVHAASESSNDEMAYICNALRDWSNSLGVTILVLHHTGKLGIDDDIERIATWSRGATDVASVLDWATFLTREHDTITLRRAGRAPPRERLYLEDKGDDHPWTLRRGKV